MDNFDHEELPFGNFDDVPDFGGNEEQGKEEGALGKCPKCGGEVLWGTYGAYCKDKCGMTLAKAFGKQFDREQVQALLRGEKVLVKDLESKKGGHYNAWLHPDGTEQYSFTNKEGKEISGFRYKFTMEFAEREKKDEQTE